MRRRHLISASVAGALVVGALVIAVCRSSHAFRSETVSFRASYGCPAQDSMIYTRMSHAVGRYEVVTQQRGSARVTVVSGDDQTATFGVSGGGEQLAYVRIQGNLVELVLLRRGRAPLIVPGRGPFSLGFRADGEVLGTLDRGVLTTWSAEAVTPTTTFVLDSFGAGEDTRRPNYREAALGGDGVVAVASGFVEGDSSLQLVSLVTGSRTMLRTSGHLMSRPRWYPDGSSLTFIAHAPDGWEVHEMCMDGGADRVIYRSSRFIESAELHRDRRHLLLTLGDGRDFEGYFTALHVFELDLISGELARVGW